MKYLSRAEKAELITRGLVSGSRQSTALPVLATKEITSLIAIMSTFFASPTETKETTETTETGKDATFTHQNAMQLLHFHRTHIGVVWGKV